MEEYVYFSIMFFSLIIIFLYIYILHEKLRDIYEKKRIENFSKKLTPYIDYVISELTDGNNVSISTLNNIKKICKNKYKREIIEKRFFYYLESTKGDFSQNLVELCEYIGVVKYEIDNLKNKNSLIKALSAKRLGEYRSKLAIKPLLNEVNVSNSDVQYNILLALAKIGEKDSFIEGFKNIDSAVILSERSLIEIVDSFEGDKTELYKVMINSDNPFIASVFIKSAGNDKHIQLSHDISKYLSSEDKELRIAASKAIGSFSAEEYLDDMLKLLEDEEWEVRAVTARVLNNFTNEKILYPLAKSLSDRQWHVRYNAATTILKHKRGMDIISYIFRGEDKFAKDIIISAIENSSNNILHSYEKSNDFAKRMLALQISEYVRLKNEEQIYESTAN